MITVNLESDGVDLPKIDGNWISGICVEKLQNCVCLWFTLVCPSGTFDWDLHYCIWAI